MINCKENKSRKMRMMKPSLHTILIKVMMDFLSSDLKKVLIL